MKLSYKALTLAIHPSSRGFGWIAMEGPFSPLDWGIVHVRGADKNTRCLRRIDRLFDRLTPTTLVLEGFEPRVSRRCTRITRLCRAIAASGVSKGVDVAIHDFSAVQRCFMSVGAKTRQEIAEAVVRELPALARYLPRPKRPWDSEAPNMALFASAAVALTDYQTSARDVLRAIADGM